MTNDIKKHSFKPGLPHEFEILDLGQLFNEHSSQMTVPHRTGFYHIIWFQEGSSTHLVDFKLVEIKPNSILFLNKDTVQSFDEKGGFGDGVLSKTGR